MMRIIAIMCETVVGGACEERVHDFVPPIPVACIYAAGPELDRITPEGWTVMRWHCDAMPAAGEHWDPLDVADRPTDERSRCW